MKRIIFIPLLAIILIIASCAKDEVLPVKETNGTEVVARASSTSEISVSSMIDQLTTEITEMITDGLIGHGPGQSSLVKLKNIKKQLAQGHTDVALTMLHELIIHLEDFAEDGTVASDIIDGIIEEVISIICAIDPSNEACDAQDINLILPEYGFVVLPNNGELSQEETSASTISDNEIQNTLDLVWYDVVHAFNQQFLINTGTNLMESENFQIEIDLPQSFITNISAGNGVYFFGFLKQGGCFGNLQLLEIIETEYDPDNQKISADIPAIYFTENTLGEFEAILTFASVENDNSSNRSSNYREQVCGGFCWTCPAPDNNCLITSGGDGSPNNYNDPRGSCDGTTKLHLGIDYRAQVGNKVLAAADGVVLYINTNECSSAGKFIIIQHQNNSKTRYLHLSSFNVIEGEPVRKGERIASSGRTGRTQATQSCTDHYSPHLHFDWITPGMGTIKCTNQKWFSDPEPCIPPGGSNSGTNCCDLDDLDIEVLVDKNVLTVNQINGDQIVDILWDDGSTTPSITVDVSGSIGVTVTDEFGCIKYATGFVSPAVVVLTVNPVSNNVPCEICDEFEGLAADSVTFCEYELSGNFTAKVTLDWDMNQILLSGGPRTFEGSIVDFPFEATAEATESGEVIINHETSYRYSCDTSNDPYWCEERDNIPCDGNSIMKQVQLIVGHTINVTIP